MSWKNADRLRLFRTRPQGASGGVLALTAGVIRWFLAV
nr:MAG TPA: hypothetical protein [Caudoviricetes sp.]